MRGLAHALVGGDALGPLPECLALTHGEPDSGLFEALEPQAVFAACGRFALGNEPDAAEFDVYQRVESGAKKTRPLGPLSARFPERPEDLEQRKEHFVKRHGDG